MKTKAISVVPEQKPIVMLFPAYRQLLGPNQPLSEVELLLQRARRGRKGVSKGEREEGKRAIVGETEVRITGVGGIV